MQVVIIITICMYSGLHFGKVRSAGRGVTPLTESYPTLPLEYIAEGYYYDIILEHAETSILLYSSSFMRVHLSLTQFLKYMYVSIYRGQDRSSSSSFGRVFH